MESGEGKPTKERSQRLRSLEKIVGGNSIVVLSIDRDIHEGLVEGIEPRAAGWVD